MFVAGERGVVRVGGNEEDLSAVALQVLQRGGAVLAQGRHHLAILGGGLGAKEHVVAVADAGIHHAVALHAQRVDIRVTGEDAIHGEPVFHRLHRFYAGTGGNGARTGTRATPKPSSICTWGVSS